jgi:hypothetical protein
MSMPTIATRSPCKNKVHKFGYCEPIRRRLCADPARPSSCPAMTGNGAKLAFAVAGERLLMRRTAPVKLTDGFRRFAVLGRRTGLGARPVEAPTERMCDFRTLPTAMTVFRSRLQAQTRSVPNALPSRAKRKAATWRPFIKSIRMNDQAVGAMRSLLPRR